MPKIRSVSIDPDVELRTRVESLSEADREFWAFRGKAARNHAHALFQYPAMMVPDMQGVLIEAVRGVSPGVKSAFDPFVGSGTTLTESMIRGLDFTGWDINPLAILICRVKAGPFQPRVLKFGLDDLLGRIRTDSHRTWETELRNVRKWFRPSVITALSRIRRGIRLIPSLWARRFFWVALAEIVRSVSNSRTSTFKLHIRPQYEVNARDANPIDLFEMVARRNLDRLSTQRKLLSELGLLNGSSYRGQVQLLLKDATATCNSVGHDLLITSPPYGDNQSTVPYGQYSYLPLHWIDGPDIDANWTFDLLATTHEIDYRSLGGSRLVSAETIAKLAELSSSLRRVIRKLMEIPGCRAKHVGAFCCDLNRAVPRILANLRRGGYMVWTVGNRRVAGQLLPLDQILIELLEARGCSLVTSLRRRIPSKRMAIRNNVSMTMRHESVLILRR